MTVKELIEILSQVNPESTVLINVESHRSCSGSEDVSVEVSSYDETVMISGEETFYQ